MRMIKKYLQRKRYNLPKHITDNWFALVVYSESAKLPQVFDKNGNFIIYKKDDIVPMEELPGELFAFYKITNINRKKGGDWLYDSDRYTYDLIFEKIDKLNT